MSLRRLRAELANLDATISMLAREYFSSLSSMTPEQGEAFGARMKSLTDKYNAIRTTMEVLEKN